ncbi:hypothetical protein SDC9_131880 [bioreactor metagenome]|uniref:Uncharacterized protein n=1 Tax=bioreactor metagenome TaxID=1076179 RepID=A0A645D647_9ZZZZ
MVAQRGAGAHAQHLQLLFGRQAHAFHVGRPLQQGLRARQQGAAVVVEQQTAPGAVEQFQRQQTFQFIDGRTGGRLRKRNGLGRAGRASGARHGHEDLQLPQRQP